MALTGEVYFADFFNGAGPINGRTPNVGGVWSGGGGVSGGHTTGQANASSSQQATDDKYVEQVIRFTKTLDSQEIVTFGQRASGGSFVSWTLRQAPFDDVITINIGTGFSFQANVPNAGVGIHEIRFIGMADVFLAYFDGRGFRVTDIPDDGRQDYDGIAFTASALIEVEEIYAKEGVEPDYLFSFTSGAMAGGFAGSSGGGGGTGGIPNPGSSNPPNIPCDTNEVLIINDGAAVSVAPTDPCMWTGQIWWKLVCEEVLTEADYAVEVEVFFNTLTDAFMSAGVIARLNETTGGHYFASLWNGEMVIGKKPSAGTGDIVLASKPLTLHPGRWYTIRLEVEGFKLRAYLNDALQLETEDSNMSFADAGCAGIKASRSNPATDIRFDNFRVWLNVKRPQLVEMPVFLESITVQKDDGMTSNLSIGIADTFNASDSPSVTKPKTVHINEGVVFTDKAGQVKRIQEFLLALDSPDVGVGINIQDVLRAAEKESLGMHIPVTDVIAFTDEERTVHGVHDTMTVQEFIAQFALDSVTDGLGARDFIRITKTSVAAFSPPEQTFYARDSKRIWIVEKGKKVK